MDEGRAEAVRIGDKLDTRVSDVGEDKGGLGHETCVRAFIPVRGFALRREFPVRRYCDSVWNKSQHLVLGF